MNEDDLALVSAKEKSVLSAKEKADKLKKFKKCLEHLINVNGVDNLYGIHDFVLADFMFNCMKNCGVLIKEERRLKMGSE